MEICVWLLAGRQVFSLLLFLFPVCRKLLALVSFTPHCSLPCFQERRDEHPLISGWLLISNLVPVLDGVSPPTMKSGQKNENTWLIYCDKVCSLFSKSQCQYSNSKSLILFCISPLARWAVSMLMMSVLCHNNYLEVLATPPVILETGESLGTRGRWDMTHFQSTNSHLVDFQPITPITLSRPLTRGPSAMWSVTQCCPGIIHIIISDTRSS